MEAYIGQIVLFAGTYEPQGWKFCNGQLIQITQNQALYAVIGTTYGGDGRSTFALPDLRGRVPVGTGQGQGLSKRDLGRSFGAENVTLTVNNLPPHSHSLSATKAVGNKQTADGALLASARVGEAPANIYAGGQPDAQLSQGAISPTGGSQAHENMQPSLALNYIICVQGMFPVRDD